MITSLEQYTIKREILDIKNRRKTMLKFDEEIKKFKPSLEVGKIKEDNPEDLIDIIKAITKNNKERK